jgi:hypothetical protein
VQHRTLLHGIEGREKVSHPPPPDRVVCEGWRVAWVRERMEGRWLRPRCIARRYPKL